MTNNKLQISTFLLLLSIISIAVLSGCDLANAEAAKAEARELYQEQLDAEAEKEEERKRKAEARRIKKKKQRLDEKLEKLQSEKKVASDNVSETKQKLQTLSIGVGELNSSIQKRNNWTLQYLEKHSVAVACLASFGYSIGNENYFSDDVNGIINAATVLCVGAAILNEDFGREVAKVVETINESDKLVKKWQSQIRTFKFAIERGLEVLKEEEADYDSIADEAEELEDEIAEL